MTVSACVSWDAAPAEGTWPAKRVVTAQGRPRELELHPAGAAPSSSNRDRLAAASRSADLGAGGAFPASHSPRPGRAFRRGGTPPSGRRLDHELTTSDWPSHVEAELHHVAVLHHVVLALHTHLAGRAGGVHRAGLDEVVEADDLGLDEALLEVGVDDACG